MIFRVETTPLGLSELRHTGEEWRLAGVTD
jgi:hypothetical protein